MEKEADMAEAWEIFEKAKKEFEDERYELVSPYLEESYKKASELTATATKIKAVAEAARANLIYFFSANWKKLLLLLAFAVLILSFFYNRISCALTRRKINSLEIERSVIKKMIAELQRNYFSLGKVSEMDYEVRLARYTEMVRDIDRQIPLLMTEVEKKSKFLKRK